MTAADICRKRGWVVGDVLVAGGEHVYELTAVGRESVLTRWLGRLDLATGTFMELGDAETAQRERVRSCALNWTKATPEQLAAIRPTSEPVTTTRKELKAGEWYEVAACPGSLGLRTDAGCCDPLDGETWGVEYEADDDPVRRLTLPEVCVRRLTLPEVCVRLLGCKTRREAAALLAEGEAFSVVEHEEPGKHCDMLVRPNWRGHFAYVNGAPVSENEARGMLRGLLALLAQRDREEAPAEGRTHAERVAEADAEVSAWDGTKRRAADRVHLGANTEPGEWVKGDTFLQRGGPFRLTPEVAQSIVSEAGGWLTTQAPAEDRTKPAPGYDKPERGGQGWFSRGPDRHLFGPFDTPEELAARSWDLHDEEAGR